MRHPFGVHAVNEAKLVDVFGCFWKQGGDPMTALPVTLKFPKGLHHHLLGVFPEVVETVTQYIDLLLVALHQPRFVIKGVYMAGPTLHEKKNDPFGARWMMGVQGAQWILARRGLSRRAHPCKGQGTKPAGHTIQHTPTTHDRALQGTR